jgi:hypothetical protein
MKERKEDIGEKKSKKNVILTAPTSNLFNFWKKIIYYHKMFPIWKTRSVYFEKKTWHIFDKNWVKYMRVFFFPLYSEENRLEHDAYNIFFLGMCFGTESIKVNSVDCLSVFFLSNVDKLQNSHLYYTKAINGG